MAPWSLRHLVFSSLLPLLAAAATVTSTSACNNSPSLCSKTYDNITHLGAHDSPFVRDASTNWSLSGNQFFNSTTQLDAGVRLLSGQIHVANSTNTGSTSNLHLCHSSCALLDAGTLLAWLSGIKTWLDNHPYEVVTIVLVNSNDASTAEIAAVYEAAGVVKYSYSPTNPYVPPSGGTWPTLATLIEANTRLLTFVASLDSDVTTATYLMNEFDFIFENSYDNTNVSDFSCQPQRPTAVRNNTTLALQTGLMPLMNHFLYSTQLLGIEIPDVGNVTSTNAYSGTAGALGTTAWGCASYWNTAPTFILVDFFNVGPAISTVDALNGVSNPTGRRNVSTAVLSAANQDTSAGWRSIDASRSMSWFILLMCAAAVLAL